MSCPDVPQSPTNRPGLPALVYRIGDYAAFRDRLLSRLTCLQVLPDQPQGISLRKLNTRSLDDPAIALLDAVAVVADVLTFYQERILNEGYLLTATERRSVLELARMIGYELNPGVAASTVLAFTVEEAPTSPNVALIPKGTQVLSIPEKDEVPQTFETSQPFTARREWNALKPRSDRPQTFTEDSRSLLLQGTSTGLQPGDALLLMDADRPDQPHYLLTLDAIAPNAAAGYTTVTWKQQLPASLETPPRNPTVLAFRQRANLFGYNAPRWESVADEVRLANGGQIKGGIYRFEDFAGEGSDRWRSVNTGLLNFDIQCLTVNPRTHTLLAGTSLGIFCSRNNGETWALSNGGLTNTNIQTLFARVDGELLAGTPNGGVFRSTDDGETWAAIGIGSVRVNVTTTGGVQTSTPENTGIPSTTVHAVASYTIDTNGRTLGTLISPDPNSNPPEERNRVTINGSSENLDLQPGDVVVAKNQAKSIIAVINSTTFRVNSPFNPRLENDRYAIFRPDPATGILQNPLVTSTTFMFAGTDEGIFRSTDQGKNWSPQQTGLPRKPVRALLTYLSGGTRSVFAVLDEGIYRTEDHGSTWIARNLPSGVRGLSLAVREEAALTLFAATDQGVYQSQDDGASWNPTGTGLPTTPILAIAVNPTSKAAFAATRSRIYRSDNNGSNWTSMAEVIAPDTELQVSAIAAFTIQIPAVPAPGIPALNVPSLFIGSALTGFANSEWHNFQIQKSLPGIVQTIDLDTTYPKLLPDSWIVFRHQNRYELVKASHVSEIQRKGFTLDSKVSRITTDNLIEKLEEFTLRETAVLVQSEVLPLMREPLTVPMQQQMIFFDPMWTNKVQLSQYVSGLEPQHPLIVSGKRIRAELLNVGGVVHTEPASALSAPQTWHRNNTGLTNTSVTAFASHRQPEVGRIGSQSLAIRGTDTLFTRELREGNRLLIHTSEPTISEPTISEPTISELIIDQIYTDGSLGVQAAASDSPMILQAAGKLNDQTFRYRGLGTGTLSSTGATVSGSHTKFTGELKVGVTLTAAQQTKRVTAILSDTMLWVEPAFDPELPPGTIFSYEGAGTGRISSDRTAIKGTGTQFEQHLQPGQAISINNQTRIIQRIHHDNLLFVDTDIESAFADISFFSNILLVGTQGGVFRSIDNAMTWEPINQGLTDLQIQAIAVRSIQPSANAPGAGYQLFVGTATGVFRTEAVFAANGEIGWQTANTNLVHLNVRVLHWVEETDLLLAGTINGGVFRSVDGAQTWQQAGLNGIDVQTLAIAPGEVWYAGTVADFVYRSRNGGRSWERLNAGLENPNVTRLITYITPGTGTLTSRGRRVMGQSASEDRTGTLFSRELIQGDSVTVAGQTRQVTQVISDTQLELDEAFEGAGITESTGFTVVRVLAGTAGSGVFQLQFDPNHQPRWQPLATQPADLNITCLSVLKLGDTTDLLAGTATGGIFRSPDQGASWRPFNRGLTSLDPRINPAARVNTEFRALATLNQHLFAVGIGMLISPDYLYTTPIRSGDRLHLMAFPTPLPDKGRERELELIQEQRWQLSDRNGFVGVVMTAQRDDIRLLPAAVDDPTISELHAVAIPPQDQQVPLLTLEKMIQTSYDPQTVKLYANVVPATHGETVRELLGSGDGAIANPQFMLKKPPLTYVPAPTASGSESTLEVRVNDIQWTEERSLYEHPPMAAVYIVRLSDTGEVTITFGDGVCGARLPTGEDNVTATYRTGLGLAGLVGSDRLSLLKTRPLGISEVTNPLPTSAAEDPETMAEAQASAPLTVRTLGRIVSLQDYEDFARAFPGIGKAQATLLGTGSAQQVHITVAALGGRDVPPDSALYSHLVKSIDAARDPVQQVQVTSYEALTFNLEARLLLDARYLPEKVLVQAERAVLRWFAFEKRNFGQAVTAAEAIAQLQAVDGVIAVDLDFLHRRDLTRSLEQSLRAEPARWDASRRQVQPAQLLVINPAALRLTLVETVL